ncbi:MAG: glycine zipper 2TM domain-containing protein [Gammaproteobacteria bacterium]|nr:glycine zipper 2TM domain-containing protein [Gammaproteobacteria bacterium]
MLNTQKYRWVILAISASLIVIPLSSGAEHLSENGKAHYAQAKVVDVEPIVRIVQIATPQEVCWKEAADTYPRHRSGQRSFAPAILGGIIGGVVGNKFGSGRGKDAMTVAGALLGASVGRDVSYQNQRVRSSHGAQQRCVIEESIHEEERIEGYRVTYRYQGRDYVTRMPDEPGKKIRVRVSVDPVAY